MSVIDRLRQNDPATRKINISLQHETSDVDLAQSLEQNPFITAITVDLEGVQTSNWSNLWRVIATRANLETVKLKDAVDPEERNSPTILVSAILRAIQQNTAIQSLMLMHLSLPTDISTFVNAASSITFFSLWNCDMEPVQRVQGARDLVAALLKNTNISTLKVGDMDDFYIFLILQSLRANVSVTTLAIGGESFSDATTRAIQQLLESTTSIQEFELVLAFFRGDEFHPFAQSLAHSRSVSALTFVSCKFRDERSAAQFQSILQNKRNLTSLCLDQCDFSGGPVYQTVISALVRPNSPLRSFELQRVSLGSTRVTNDQFQKLLQAIEKSKLEHFAIGDVKSQQQLQTLTASIPLMRIKKLEIEVDRDFDDENIRQDLLRAVENNFSLRSVQGDRDGESIFDDDDETKLTFFADRNERLDQWVDNPETLERKVWPEALKLAEKEAIPNSLFRGLHSVLESDHMSLPRGRKRKRPQFFVPS